jgi:small ligand-binding sensory domain FIST
LGAPLWDVTRVLSRFGTDVPVVGVTQAGELARLGGSTLVMGHTAVISAVIAAP